MASKTANNGEEFPIHGAQWIFYVLGWLCVFNLLFWIVQVIVYLAKHNGESLFNRDFHRVVFYFGIAMAVVFAIMLVVGAVLIASLFAIISPMISSAAG